MNALPALLLACVCATAAPWLAGDDTADRVQVREIPRWPSHFEGRMLTPVPLSVQERGFLAGFPGEVERFTDGERDIVMRWVTQPTRRLHPATDCYRGLGFAV